MARPPACASSARFNTSILDLDLCTAETPDLGHRQTLCRIAAHAAGRTEERTVFRAYFGASTPRSAQPPFPTCPGENMRTSPPHPLRTPLTHAAARVSRGTLPT